MTDQSDNKVASIDGKNSLPRNLVGRMAAAITIIGAVVSLAAEGLAGHLDEHVIVSTVSAIVAGGILWFLPWERWGNRGTYVFFLLALIALIVGQIEPNPDRHELSVPLLLITLFVWNGLAHDRWTSMKFAPLAALAYVGPPLVVENFEPDVFSAVLTISLAVLIGESVSWVSTRLTTAEAEHLLNQYKIDFLTAAQHEMRTPLTSIAGYARMLRTRDSDISLEQKQEFYDAILRSAERLERLAQRLVDVDRARRGEAIEVEELGLLAAHYGQKEIRLDDPLRGNTQEA